MSQLLSKTSSLLVALILGSLPGAAMAGTCGVLPFSAGDDVNRGAAPNITALVSSELDIRGGYDLVIAAPPEDFEGGDCGASTTCIKEFGRANKHEAVVSGSVVTDGDEYRLTVKVHDASSASVQREVTRNVPTSALDLADAVTNVVIELVTGQAPDEEEDGAASASSGPLFDDVDFDELLDEAEAESAKPAKKKRSRAAPRNPDRDEELDLDDSGDDPFGIDELDTLDMSADQIEKQKRDRERQAEADRARKEEEDRIARARAEEERQRRIAEEREREERARARAEREEREQQARAEAERREERERQDRIREEREREERERARAAREAREREEAERQARADREERERRDRDEMERARREREESERVARADRDRRGRDDQAQREQEERERRARERAAEESADDDGGLVLGSALAGIVIGGDDDDDEGGFSIGPADDDEDDYEDDYELEDDEPREGMIIGDDEKENPNVRRRREATESRDDDEGSSDRYSRARTFNGDSSASSSDGYRRAVDQEPARREYDQEYDDDLEDLDDGDRDYARDDRGGEDRDYSDRSYEERSYGSEPVASRDDAYLSDDYEDSSSRSYRAGRSTGTRAKSTVSRSDTGWGNRPYFSARLGGGYTNYYLHFAQYGVDLGIFPVPRVSVDLQADFWTLSIRECPECEQQYRTLPSFYLGGSYRFTNLKFVQPYVGGDVGTVVYAVGTLTAEDGTITRRPLMGVAFAVKGGADFMFTKHFGISAGVKAGVAYASKIKENVHPDWNPLQFLVNVRIAAVVQF